MTSELERLHIGLGGQRCGSTWLHENLSRHPMVVPARGEKEVHFFDRRWDRGPEWYFDLWREAQWRGAEVVRWESTPNYLYIDRGAERIAQTCGGARFVVLLRDPVGRSRSHYRRYLANSGRGKSFRALVEQRPSLLRYSRYAEHLEPFFDTFGRDAFFIGFYEDILRRPTDLFRDITDFMGLEPLTSSEASLSERVNALRVPRNRALYGGLYATKCWMKKLGLDGLVAAGRRWGVLALLSRQAVASKTGNLNADEMEMLLDLRRGEIDRLGRLGIDARHWAADKTDVAS